MRPVPCLTAPLLPSSLLLALLAFFAVPAYAQDQASFAAESARAGRHSQADWLLVEPHLPDPRTATAAQLEVAGDVLRARRLPEDALEFYRHAIDRGGDPSHLLLRIGMTQLELHQILLANLSFRLAVKRHATADGWNDLAATEYLLGQGGHAVSDYRRAVKMDGSVASYHSNLGTAYLDAKNFKRAREEFATAIQLDPEVFVRAGTGGIQAHLMSSADHARFCFEMARLAFEHHNEADMLAWLTRASEDGFDVLGGLGAEPKLASLREDPRIKQLVLSGEAIRHPQVSALQTVPALDKAPPPPATRP